jgi:hypothetical protein
VRPLPNEIAICRASLLEHAVLLRGVYERLPATALSRDARENTCARFLWAILEGGKLKRWVGGGNVIRGRQHLSLGDNSWRGDRANTPSVPDQRETNDSGLGHRP